MPINVALAPPRSPLEMKRGRRSGELAKLAPYETIWRLAFGKSYDLPRGAQLPRPIPSTPSSDGVGDEPRERIHPLQCLCGKGRLREPTPEGPLPAPFPPCLEPKPP